MLWHFDLAMQCFVASSEAPGGEVQTATARFFVPVAAAYMAACVGWLVLRRFRLAPVSSNAYKSDRPWTDFGLGILAAVGIFLLGAAYRSGWLLPNGTGLVRVFSWQFNNVIIFSPIAAVLLLRGQPSSTVYVEFAHAGRNALIGLGMALVSTVIFLGLRGEFTRLGTVWAGTLNGRNLSHFLSVMMEGVALAFLFERMRWCMQLGPALLIPSLLFAAGHIPSQIESGLGGTGMAAFFVLNTLLPMFILYVVSVARDVIWLAIVHYVMDIAIRAFG